MDFFVLWVTLHKQGQERGRLGAIDRQAQQTVRKFLVCIVVVATWQHIQGFSYSSKLDHCQELNQDLFEGLDSATRPRRTKR